MSYSSNPTALDQAKVAGLNFTANALVRVGVDPVRLAEEMADQIGAVERETNRKVILCNGLVDGLWFALEQKPLKRRGQGFAKVTKPNEVRFLTAKLDGVVMSANFFKPFNYNHENRHVAQALRRLADLIEKSAIRLADNDVELDVG